MNLLYFELNKYLIQRQTSDLHSTIYHHVVTTRLLLMDNCVTYELSYMTLPSSKPLQFLFNGTIRRHYFLYSYAEEILKTVNINRN